MLETQMDIFDFLPDSPFGKTCLDACPQEPLEEKTSASSWKSFAKWQTPTLQCLDLRGNGRKQDASSEMDIPWLGGLPIANGGEFHSAENGFVSFAISMDTQHPTYYLTLNCSEMPREVQVTKLSDILEEDADPKYHLSAKACQGILRRAEVKGKGLPDVLKKTLETQALRGEDSTHPKN